MTQGRFITFEGGEGTGKSTQVARLVERLRARDMEVVQTREPGGSAGAEDIRNIALNGDANRWSPMTETLLMFAARSDHLERTIRPALETGRWVVCAISQTAVGVDVEQVRPFDLVLAWRFFHRHECAALAVQPAAAQHDYFFRLWTAKEAYMKALGLGFQRDMASFSVAPRADLHVALDDPQVSSQPYMLSHLELDPGYRLALCRQGQPVQVLPVTLDHLLSLTIIH